jgi:hypothetical protein
MQERAHSDGQNTGGVKESTQPDIYTTMISSVLGPTVRKLEALDGHIEGLTNNIGTYDIKVNALVGQVTSLLTVVKTNEALIIQGTPGGKQTKRDKDGKPSNKDVPNGGAKQYTPRNNQTE